VITKTDVRGIMPPLYTPFTEEGDLDPAAFRREVQMMRELPITGVVVGGSTGEGHALSIDELAELCRIAIDEVGGSMPVIARIITTTTRDAIARGRAARDAGVGGTMVTPPIYQNPDAAAMIDYYSQIRAQVGLPVIIYNVLPHAPVTPEVTRRLADQEVVIATKESAGGSLHCLRLSILLVTESRLPGRWITYSIRVLRWALPARSRGPGRCSRGRASRCSRRFSATIWRKRGASTTAWRR
jgi:4-hydroxy-tetrahydrodipicolinate synthase